MKEQFAGWGLYDNAAICLTCGHQHLIAKAEQVTAQPWLDWLTRHPGHDTFIVPYRVLTQLNGLRQNANIKIAYAASADYTMVLTGLATDATLLTGRESTGLSNAVNLYLDELVSGKVTTGTSPTASKQIEVHVSAALDDVPNYGGPFDGTESAETLASDGLKASICRAIAVMATSSSSDVTYPFPPTGIRQFHGDGLPVAHVLFVTHNTGVNLNATATNQKLTHTPVYATIV